MYVCTSVCKRIMVMMYKLIRVILKITSMKLISVWKTKLTYRQRSCINILKSYGIPGWVFGLVSSLLSNGCLRVVLDEKSTPEYPINARIHEGSALGPTLFLLYINDFLMLSVVLLSMLMILLSTLSVIRHMIHGNS